MLRKPLLILYDYHIFVAAIGWGYRTCKLAYMYGIG